MVSDLHGLHSSFIRLISVALLVTISTASITTICLYLQSMYFQDEKYTTARPVSKSKDDIRFIVEKPEIGENNFATGNDGKGKLIRTDSNTKRILFYNPAPFQIVRNVMNLTYFDQCKVSNCRMSFDQKDADVSDAVIIDWRTLIYKPNFTRPRDQVWIFIQHEVPSLYWGPYPIFYYNMKNTFNWTMTYSKKSDIYLPYGELRRKGPKEPGHQRGYLEIAKSKTKDAIWVTSHCTTEGNRENYVSTLQKYIGVETLGACGRPWCGKPHDHELDNCFSILNSSYRFHLAFENSLCANYITEKFYENYKYDIIQIVRGGKPRERPIDVNKNAYISASDFTNAHALGMYLRELKLNQTRYAEMMAAKDEYLAIPYTELFKRAMCDVCERLHNLDEYRQTYEDVYHWMQTQESCYTIRDF